LIVQVVEKRECMVFAKKSQMQPKQSPLSNTIIGIQYHQSKCYKNFYHHRNFWWHNGGITYQNMGIMFKVEFQTSFWHGSVIFSKNCKLRKVGKSRYISSLKTLLWFWASKKKLWTKFREGVWICKRKCPFHPLWILFITFIKRLKISNDFLEMKISLIFQLS